MADQVPSEIILPFAPRHLEVEKVLNLLRDLRKRACNPVVSECLLECCAEICYLTASEGTFEDYVARECTHDLSQEETFKEAV